jgi:hypothetical protein
VWVQASERHPNGIRSSTATSTPAPTVKRKITAGPDGLRLLALGATPGEAYDTGGTL